MIDDIIMDAFAKGQNREEAYKTSSSKQKANESSPRPKKPKLGLALAHTKVKVQQVEAPIEDKEKEVSVQKEITTSIICFQLGGMYHRYEQHKE